VEEEQSDDIVIRLIYPPKVDKRIHRRRKRAIEPPPSLADKLGRRLGDVRLGCAVLDVGQRPFLVLLCNELEAEDPVFS